MKILNVIFQIMIIFLISCSKEAEKIDIINPTEIQTPEIPVVENQIYETKVFRGKWRYTTYYTDVNLGTIMIDTTYPGTFELNISQDSIKSENDFFRIAKSKLFTDSLATMRPNGYCRCNSRIELSPDEKNLRYVRERYPQNAGGTMKHLFIGEKL